MLACAGVFENTISWLSVIVKNDLTLTEELGWLDSKSYQYLEFRLCGLCKEQPIEAIV